MIIPLWWGKQLAQPDENLACCGAARGTGTKQKITLGAISFWIEDNKDTRLVEHFAFGRHRPQLSGLDNPEVLLLAPAACDSAETGQTIFASPWRAANP